MQRINEINRVEKLLNKLNRLLNSNQSGGTSSIFDESYRERILSEYIDSKLYGKNLSGVSMLTIMECNINEQRKKYIYLVKHMIGENHVKILN